ncbi:FXYD domain-containing ion transport regulator 4-like isoform X4 [Catharus ustulatus]|uniref:FXYD domain-containing ion transport regulator 4-like isoform X4 n=1 Tax=Catharus ustulatus TaxID=91951 RepID=UPI00140C6F75|nr:FXYD domain-containing ion transport regulator 4-like isoform X4 [Catharus ustulatus]
MSSSMSQSIPESLPVCPSIPQPHSQYSPVPPSPNLRSGPTHFLGHAPSQFSPRFPPISSSSWPLWEDWCHLRVGGLVVAAVLSVVGIIVLFSGMCKCRSKASRRRPPPELSPVPGTGAASSC